MCDCPPLYFTSHNSAWKTVFGSSFFVFASYFPPVRCFMNSQPNLVSLSLYGMFRPVFQRERVIGNHSVHIQGLRICFTFQSGSLFHEYTNRKMCDCLSSYFLSQNSTGEVISYQSVHTRDLAECFYVFFYCLPPPPVPC